MITLTRELEDELRKLLEDYWDSYIRGDITTWASYLPDHYKNIGTTEAEVWNSKQEILDYTNSVIDQLAGLADIRDRVVSFFVYDPYIMSHEIGNMYLKTDTGWNYYGKLRLSSLLEKTSTGWKILHQHGSFPDTIAEKGETFGFEGLNKENAELRDAVKRRTSELELKNRELEIETALERVRAESLGMNRPEDMLKVCKVIAEELEVLGLNSIRNIQTAIFNKEKNTYMNYEYYLRHGREVVTEVDYGNEKVHGAQLDFVREMLSGEGGYYTRSFVGQELTDWYQYQKGTEQLADEYLLKAHSLNYYMYSLGSVTLGISTYYPMVENDLKLFERCRKVFKLAYRRYLDIQEASMQKREAEVQLALERVRARTMAMQHSDELSDASFVLDSQVRGLGIKTRGCAFNIYGENESTEWFSGAEGTFPVYPTPRENLFLRYYMAGQSGKAMHIEEFSGEACVAHYEYLSTVPVMGDALREMKKAGVPFPSRQVDHVIFFKYGYLLFITLEPVPESHDIFLRFGKVFEQTYTRFLDLKKAEAQSREAQIELALERVRAKTMAMQKSAELADTASVLFRQIKDLGFETWSCGFCIWKKNELVELWMGADSGGLLPPMLIPFTEEPTHADIYQASLGGNPSYNKIWEDEGLEKHYAFLRTIPSVNEAIAVLEASGLSLPEKQCYYVGFFKQGYLLLITKEASNELQEISSRFSKVFEQTYTRFLDLEKAEAQAREALIEAALERVRSRTMGMQKSDELKEIIKVVYEQIVQLNIHIEHSGFIINYKEREDMHIWLADEHMTPFQINIPYFDSPHWNSFLHAKENGDDFFSNLLDFDTKNKFYLDLFKLIPELPAETRDYYFSCPGLAISTVLLDNVGLYIENFSGNPYTEEENNTLMRFGKVFQQTYTRFLDLQRAEAQAKEAQIEAALERVRSRTLAMQKSEELTETAAVLFKQLIQLGIAPNRLYIAIIKADDSQLEFWVTDEDGRRVSNMFIADASRNASMKKMYKGWQTGKKSIAISMEGQELTDYFNYLANDLHVPFKDALFQKRRIQSIAYFGNGFIGIASPDEQSEETIHLLERFAAVFNLTYTRFNDLKIAEAHAIQAEEDLIKLQREKKRAEEALSELRMTQTQLIQAEKMASLGELTAGIAHEIQNPLNFVNNFSEVSSEMMDEMIGEVNKGNFEEVKSIVADLKQNLEKINHHGKRADGIVKGMLQHSRSSSGQKEPTDINALVDEYLRLAYHGIRAKDKTFNSTLQTEYDQSIGLVNIVPQDIGRVILNLITNAFYAVNERSISSRKNADKPYTPTVSVLTRKVGQRLEVQVSDNGTGIPSAIREKVFQPFFTTKPTGQGTGLGLSLAYDIVKAHGGELKMESEEGIGTVMVIMLSG